MATFQTTREQTAQKVMVHMLSELERNPAITQRNLAAELGIALGLINGYLKRCITQGWIRGRQISAKRITYFLTAEGFKEKSRMVTDYLSRSLTFFRDARLQCERTFEECLLNGWTKVALIGAGDLADIATLVAQGTGLSIVLISSKENLSLYDAVLITDIIRPQQTYDFLKDKLPAERLLTLALLHISLQKMKVDKV